MQSNTVEVNALVKRLDRWMNNLFISTDEYLTSAHEGIPVMSQPPIIPIDKPVKTVKKSKQTFKKKSVPKPPTPIVTKPPTPIVTKPPTPIVPKIEAKIELVKPIITKPSTPIQLQTMMDDIDKELTLLHALGDKYKNLVWTKNSSFVQLVLTSVIDKYDHPFIYDIKYNGKYAKDVVMDTNGLSIGLYPGVMDDNEDGFPIDYKSLGVQLQAFQNKDIIVIPVYFTILYPGENDKQNEEQHLNMLIYRPKIHVVENFEPHGSMFYSKHEYLNEFNAYIETSMIYLWENQLTKYIGNTKYIPRDIVCPMREGLQVLSGGEYCALISIFVAEMCLQNPTVLTSEIISKVYDISKKDPAYIKNILNGYIVMAFKDVKTYTQDVYMHLSKNEQMSYDFLKKQIPDTPIVTKPPTPIVTKSETPKPPTPTPKKNIPPYEPPESYTEQQDSYSGYDTYGDYGDKNLVFPTIEKYMDVLNACNNIVKKLNIHTEFCKMLTKQIHEISSPILLDFLYTFIIQYGKIIHDLTYDDSMDETMYEAASITYEEINNVCDKIALCQYSLDVDKYEQFLKDLEMITCKKPTPKQMLDIGIKFLVKYKFITKAKLNNIAPDVDTIRELIASWNRDIKNKKEEIDRKVREEKQKAKEMYRQQTEYSVEKAFAPPPKRPQKK